jgi:hypothetical protein
VSNRLRKYTEQLLNPHNVQSTPNKFNETMTHFTGATPNLQLQPIQYDYLKRFIKQLEDETLAMHRQAKQRKMLNQQYDQRVKHEETKRDVLRATYKDSIKQQLAHNSEKKQRHAQNELLVPHIQGTEGYPPVPEPSKEELVTKKRGVAVSLRAALD